VPGFIIDMLVNKRSMLKIALVGDRRTLILGVIAVSFFTIFFSGCSASTDELTEAYQSGYEQGKLAGYEEGYDAGLAFKKDYGNPSSVLPVPSTSPVSSVYSGDEFSWEVAIDHVGEITTICGPVIGTHWASSSNGKPTFINVGKDYPSSDRFVVLIWDDHRSAFPQPPEDYYQGKMICVTGLVQEYDGCAEIVISDPEQIEIQ